MNDVLRRWDQFVQKRSLPYYRQDHKQMMRRVLDRYPIGKLGDLSDIDLYQAAAPNQDPQPGSRSFAYFLTHFERFLDRNQGDHSRGVGR